MARVFGRSDGDVYFRPVLRRLMSDRSAYDSERKSDYAIIDTKRRGSKLVFEKKKDNGGQRNIVDRVFSKLRAPTVRQKRLFGRC